METFLRIDFHLTVTLCSLSSSTSSGQQGCRWLWRDILAKHPDYCCSSSCCVPMSCVRSIQILNVSGESLTRIRGWWFQEILLTRDRAQKVQQEATHPISMKINRHLGHVKNNIISTLLSGVRDWLPCPQSTTNVTFIIASHLRPQNNPLLETSTPHLSINLSSAHGVWCLNNSSLKSTWDSPIYSSSYLLHLLLPRAPPRNMFSIDKSCYYFIASNRIPGHKQFAPTNRVVWLSKGLRIIINVS